MTAVLLRSMPGKGVQEAAPKKGSAADQLHCSFTARLLLSVSCLVAIGCCGWVHALSVTSRGPRPST
eukprot:456407-Alexandrium_andersonii.AAC.1